MCLRNKVLKTLEYVKNFTYLDTANITSKQKTDRTKVAIKIENITSFGGIYIISLWLFILPHWFGWGISCLEKTQETLKHLISTYRAPQKTSQHIKFSHKKKYCEIKE